MDGYVYSMYVCMCLLVYVSVYVYVCIMLVCVYVYVCVCISSCVCMVASYSDPNPFDEIRTRYGRFGVVLVMDPIHWRFEDRPMGWAGDSYQFVRWRPDSNPVPKPRHFMWVFVLMSFPYLPLIISNYVLLALFHVGKWYIFPVYYYLYHFMRHQWLHPADMSVYLYHFMW